MKEGYEVSSITFSLKQELKIWKKDAMILQIMAFEFQGDLVLLSQLLQHVHVALDQQISIHYIQYIQHRILVQPDRMTIHLELAESHQHKQPYTQHDFLEYLSQLLSCLDRRTIYHAGTIHIYHMLIVPKELLLYHQLFVLLHLRPKQQFLQQAHGL
jgi:hypothetical protein